MTHSNRLPRSLPLITVLGAILSSAVAPASPLDLATSARIDAGASMSTAAATPRFTDPARRSKLATAYPQIDLLVNDFLQREKIPGAAWGVVVDGELVHVGVAGLRDVAANAPVQSDTVFRIASMTKSFTAMAILQLRDAGRLSLDDPVDKYLPELRRLRYPTDDAPRLTLRHLLTHSAGFPEDNPWGDQQLAISEAQFDQLLRGGIAFANPPGVAYEYSNYGFAILGRVVTRVAGMPYRDYVQRRILAPLGMRSTTLEPAAVPPTQLARGYRREDDLWKLEPQLADGAFGPMGGMLTSLEDLGRYVGVFLDAWPPRDGPTKAPLSRASLREMQQLWRMRPAVVTRDAAGAIELNAGGYGYGLRISQSCEFGHVVAHSGGLPGFGSQMRWLPEYGVGLIAFGNRTYSGWGGVFDAALAALQRSGGLLPREVQPSAALSTARRGVNSLLMRWDDAELDRLAAMNLLLDRSRERRRLEFARLRDTLGVCRERPGWLYSENALRGDWLLDCERGVLQASVTLAPTLPPGVQHLELRSLPADAEIPTVTGLPPRACPQP
ncbi:MAG: beta-lactamase family protein [Gammaproteobacteria bacterium]|nr:beta-lactamase family protein [Gammaproteobacteria bacterium]